MGLPKSHHRGDFAATVAWICFIFLAGLAIIPWYHEAGLIFLIAAMSGLAIAAGFMNYEED